MFHYYLPTPYDLLSLQNTQLNFEQFDILWRAEFTKYNYGYGHNNKQYSFRNVPEAIITLAELNVNIHACHKHQPDGQRCQWKVEEQRGASVCRIEMVFSFTSHGNYNLSFVNIS
jgi:hypothetical protein